MKSFSELYLNTVDNVQIAINHYNSGRKHVLVVAPGWTMSKDSIFIRKIAKNFSRFFDVIAMDFRGHGKSSGYYTFTSSECRDLDSVVSYAKSIYKNVYLMGFSLGGAISIIYSAMNKNIDGLIAVSAPHSFKKIKHHMWVKDFLQNEFKKYESRVLLKLRPFPFFKKIIRPIDVVDKIDIPTLFIAGDADSIIHSDDTKALFDSATCEKHFEMFKNCNHAEDLIFQDKVKFIKICKDWLFFIEGRKVSPDNCLQVI